ncbi:hypothetical protein M7I_1652 [Glarea lozoyensis 74030]|uniref:Uncharacterized protein n=1 Tax=Glarea lozoyensis (strain ATCC 74030 / MF5533) TaxID=1104152 RepID=H0EGN5_GLAL7|nr:hypothetical protein M7I_1652 [Glarea lozoyensis 74030]
MSQIRSTLTRLLAEHKRLWVNETESIDNNFALDGLDRVDNDCNGSRSSIQIQDENGTIQRLFLVYAHAISD